MPTKAALGFLMTAVVAAAQGTVFVGTWPHTLQFIDEAQQKVVEKIELITGLPRRDMQLSVDRKTLYIATLERSGFEVLDIATRKVTNTLTLNEGTKQIRVSAWSPDPEGKQIYMLYRTIEKKLDRYDVDRTTRFAVVDLAQKKIVRTGEVPKDEEQPIFGFGGTMRFSPDGKYLYVFRNSVFIFDTADFKMIDKIDLAKPDAPGMMNVGIGRSLDSIQEAGVQVSVFNSQDPVVHRNIFGIARFDLSNRTFQFVPVGPATTGMLGLQVTPDRKKGYTVAFNGQGGTRRCEFWELDLPTSRLIRKQEFDGRPRFSLGISSTGKDLYIYGAGYDVEVYDTATLQLRNTIDLNADTTAGLVVLPATR
jgi:DNA-binding beta-propeller fold protein YncE